MAISAYHDEVQKIYIAYYGRPADPVGLNFWANKLSAANGNLDEIIDAFGNSAESTALYNGASNSAKISQIYQQLFNRAPEAEGLNYYVELLANGQATLATIALDILNGASGSDLSVVSAKLDAANDFTGAIDSGAETSAYDGDWAAQQARDWLHDVTQPGDGGDPQAVIDAIVAGPAPDGLALTSGIDTIAAAAGQVVVGGTDTLTNGDKITGAAQVELSLASQTSPYSGSTIDGAQKVTIMPTGDVEVTTKKWVNIEQIAVEQVKGNLLLDDLQSADTQYSVTDAIRAEDTVHFNFDAQGVNGKAVNLSVNEVNAKIVLDADAGATIDTINLKIADQGAGYESNLAALVGDGTSTLNISGGKSGLNFGIEGALDSTLTTLNAAAAASNLRLNVSESDQDMTITLGSGNDILNMGDSLSTGDVIDGGSGNDRVIAVFEDGSDANRAPEMRRVETLEATFLSAVHFNGANVDGLRTIDLNASSARADFDMMDSTLSTVNVKGSLAQGMEVDYDGAALASLDINLQGETSIVGNAANPAGVRVINADKVSLNHNGTQDVTINGGIQVDETFSGRYTTDLNITNNSVGDLSVLASETVIRSGDTVERLSITSTDVGDMNLGDCDVALMENASNLQHFVASSATDSDITMGRVGTWNAATDLESIKLSVGVSSEMTSHGFVAREHYWYDGDGATVNSVDINVKNSGELHLVGGGDSYGPAYEGQPYAVEGDYCPGPWLEAASLNAMTVNVAKSGSVDGGVLGLVGLDLGAQAGGSTLTVAGEGTVTGFAFMHENVATINATGLTGSGLVVAMLDEANASGFTFLGSNKADRVYASDEADVLEGNGGNDVIWARGGNDAVNGGEGDDDLYGGSGNDAIDGGAGNDFIAGDTGTDVLTGGAGQDSFYFYFGNSDPTDAGKSTNPGAASKQDIITDFNFGEDTLYVDINARDYGYFSGQTLGTDLLDGNYSMYVTNMSGANPLSTGGYIGSALDPISVIVRVGTYNENGTFNYDANGTDLQLLFNNNGDAFNPLDAVLNNGNVAFSQADHEVGLLGTASQLGSLAVSDLVWV